ncbi:MAG: site-specific DNA-methyltransferase [Rhodospirillales bacterium]|nr:site-specific DNA-methyltransferase [Rhodospirillales bacterium]
MTFAPFITLPFAHERAAPPFSSDADKYPDSVVRYFLDRYTKKGDRVFDPFMGLGTTAFVAEDMGRIPYGFEHDRERFEWVAGQLEHWTHIHNDDAANMRKYALPKMDFAITSPPYMPKHHKWNPLYGGDPAKAGYDKYLSRMAYIFKALAQTMKRNSFVVVHADNLYHGPHYTPLVRDLGLAAEKSMALKAETTIKWENPQADYTHTHCLIFKNTQK